MKFFQKAYLKIKNDERGMGTLEILLIVAVLVGIALLFKDKITEWVVDLLNLTDTQIGEFDPDSIQSGE